VGAFKLRGACNAVLSLTEDEVKRGVVTHSSGNHAQALALAASLRGIAATIVMPANANPAKVAAVEGYGGRVVRCEPTLEARETTAARVIAETGAVLVHPYDDPRVIAGQGTAALELLGEVSDLDAVLTPCGGAGLLAGTAVAATGVSPGIRVLGVEPEAGDDVARSLREGRRVRIDVPDTIADSLQTTCVGERNLAILSALVEGVLTASDLELRKAMAFLFSRMKLVVEPGGAAAAAALLAGRVPGVSGCRVGVVLSGGNVDPARFAELVAGLPA
jgi:threonine dehydratase/serine racemase